MNNYSPLDDKSYNAHPSGSFGIELSEQHARPAQTYSPPSPLASPLDPPLDYDKQLNNDSKTNLQPQPSPGRNWQLQSQQVARITPLRAAIIILDAIIASTPIMFIGMVHSPYSLKLS